MIKIEDIKYLLNVRSKWKYNIIDGKLICGNKKGITYIFENKDDNVFQSLLSYLSSKGTPDPLIRDIQYEQPKVEIPFELFHRVMRANEILYQQYVGLKQNTGGLFCFSSVCKNYQLNHHKYKEKKEVYVDPQKICQISRRVRDRERVHCKILLEDHRIILECSYPWITLTIIIPTIQGKLDDD